MSSESLIFTGITIPENLTQTQVDANPQLKRLQHDLLVLTCFPENSTLHWRPPWFAQGHYASRFWTLHNPPNVVTGRLPSDYTAPIMTRRMRKPDDPPPHFIKTSEQWRLYCQLYGVPEDFLDEKQVRLMRMGLLRDKHGNLRAPPTHPRYPEPQPLNQGNYLLDSSFYKNLPWKFELVDDHQTVAVVSTGEVKVVEKSDCIHDRSQWNQYSGTGEQVDDMRIPTTNVLKYEGKGRRWCHLPWTEEQENSCRPFKLKLRHWNDSEDSE